MKAEFNRNEASVSDIHLMDRFYSGDMDAFGQLAERARESLMRQALRRLPSHLVGRSQAAEDLVQQTLIKAYRTFDRPETRWQQTKGAVSTWLGTILRNVVISYLRSRASKTRVSSDLWGACDNEDSDPLENTIVDHRLMAEHSARDAEANRTQWRQYVGQLPTKMRSVVQMKMQGKSHQEIADRLGVTRSTITYRIKNAAVTLRTMAAA